MEINNFDRWSIPYKGAKTWAYMVFNKYETELKRLDMSFQACKDYTFKSLTFKDKAQLNDIASLYLKTGGDNSITIQMWRNTFGKMFLKWHQLNKLMALSAYFETYIASIIHLIIESNPSIILGISKKIDGIQLCKAGETIPVDFTKDTIENCTKGAWSKRLASIKKLLLIKKDHYLSILLDKSVKELECIRKMRNKVGHAFGRDIDDSRKWYETETPKINSLKEKRYLKWQKLIKAITRELDQYVMENHIGSFQELFFYHNHLNEFDKTKDISQKAIFLKEKLYEEKKLTYNKQFCKGLIDYYDNLT